ncbi:MAG: Cytochrome [Rhodoferax sp.]|nr:Cytochrome [Rhodoferax sp.]
MNQLQEFQFLHRRDPAAASRRLLEWLSNDAARTALYRCLASTDGPLAFESPADTRELATDPGDSHYRQTVYLVTRRAHVERAFTRADEFSNAPFRALGGGNFMLALEPGLLHTAQRRFALKLLDVPEKQMLALATLAFQAGALLVLKQRKFDLAELAEQVALRYMGFLFGFAQSDHALMEGALRKAYRGLCYQVMGRHFVSEPATVAEANAGMGALLKRTSELIGLYRGAQRAGAVAGSICTRCGRQGHEDGIACQQADEIHLLQRELDELRGFGLQSEPGRKDLADFVPLLRRIVADGRTDPQHSEGFSDTELASMVVGLMAGAVGNMQASICIAMNHFLRLASAADLTLVEKLAQDARAACRGAGPDVALTACVAEALRRNPPVAFLPRKALKPIHFGPPGGEPDIPEGSIVLLGIGGATLHANDRGTDSFRLPADMTATAACRHRAGADLVFGGGLDDAAHVHSCVGQRLSMPLIVHVVRQMLVLPGLAEACDPRTGRPAGLQKLWGYGCQSYPMEFRRDAILTQSPLSVIMKIKSPTAEHAEKLKQVIKYGAPSIEKKLMDARHVHFAFFHFLENDTKLGLFTVFDRDFDSYLAHFALEIGPLFDKIFEHIENAPPLPVNEFPREFVDTIRRFHMQPAGGYFFSAYPNADVAKISRAYERVYP